MKRIGVARGSVRAGCQGRRSRYSLVTSVAFLSSRSPTNFECRKWLSLVHSRYSIYATSTGFSHTHSFIFSFVSP